ncbi:MAG: hypothetical protein ACRDOK_03410 [Streptosporangiaceae bacterium]
MSPGLSYLRFANPLDGFAFGSQLWATHDGGASWQHVWLPGSIGDLETSAGVVYAAVMSQDHTVTIYRSLASGGLWTPVQGLPSNVPAPLARCLGRLHHWQDHAARRRRVDHPGRPVVRHADRSELGQGAGQLRAGLRDGQRRRLQHAAGHPAMRRRLGHGSQGKILYSSGDGGASFSLAGMPPLVGDQLKLLAQPTAQHIFMAASSGATRLDVSGDGGHTWGTALTINDGGAGWSDFGFTTAAQGVAIAGNSMIGSHMYMTWDAGQTWHRVTF